MLAFTLGLYEMLAIGGIALLLFGTRLPSVGKSLGSAIVQFRKAIKGDEEPTSDQTPAKTTNDNASK